jgi:trypsin
MRSIKIGSVPVVAVTIALMVAAIVYADGQDLVSGQAAALAGEETLLEKSRRVEVELEIARANLGAKVRAALGDAFGGAWFEGKTRQMHVGVTSPEDRLTVEAVAGRVGLAHVVTEIPVRSTWTQLADEQERWNDRLDDLFERALVKTGIAPDRNAVMVELGAAVPSSRRAELRREAASADVEVSIAIASSPRLGLRLQGRCADFKSEKAHCDPTIVAGVTIEDEKPTGRCTAGPAVVRQAPKKPTAATETFVLTAGHCVSAASGSWYAFNKEGKSKTLGPGVKYRTDIDVGVIKVNNPVLDKKTGGYWAVAGRAPVTPANVRWEGKEPEPNAVTGQWDPMKGEVACLSGQTTGFQCGEIIEENVTSTKGVEELFEVEGVTTQEGDSGGPWWHNGSASLVGGTHVGKFENGNAGFNSLKSSFSRLEMKLELLTTNGEFRHPFDFKSEGTAVLTGEQEGEGEMLAFDAGTLSCKKATYTGELAGTVTGELVVTPVYSECKLAGNSATVDINGCQYAFTPAEGESGFAGGLNIVCPEEKKIEVTGAGCKITIGPQNDLEDVTYTNTGSGSTRKITIDLDLSGFAYEEHNVFPSTCAANTVPKTNGTYEGTALISAETGEKAHRGIWAE